MVRRLGSDRRKLPPLPADLRVSGVEASLTYVGNVDHTTSAFRSLPRVLDWFTGLRRTP
ncbi:hypothetical protein [Nonomuraea sp. NPDC049784]|uniref:hypothetical protein n=1 Tax=Nonomuraea sp. NPDC049784 TaxID=3154361 RepID=UPI0033E7D1B7